jgi:8-oxo-dGTP pyrophosphatase MutT (NUDIX family)
MIEKIKIENKKYAAGVLPVCLSTGRILLGKRGPKLEKEPNKWCDFGGKANNYETPYETAIREFYEETGKIVPIKIIPSFVNTTGEMDYYNFIGIVYEEFIPLVNVQTVDYEIEVSDYKWMTVEEFFKFPSSKLHWGLDLLRKKAKEQIKSLFN